MARSPNSRCDFKQGFFTCNLPVDEVQLADPMCQNEIWETHTERGKEKKNKKYRPWAKWTDNDGSRCALDSLIPSISSDSGAWLPTPEFKYKPKFFDNPRNSHSSEENMPPLESTPTPMLNIEETDILDRTKKLLGKDNR